MPAIARRLLRAALLTVLLLTASCAKPGGASAITLPEGRGDPAESAQLPPASAPSAPAAAREPSTGGDGEPSSESFQGWCRHGGAALVGAPVLDADGRLYLVTADGYLHAFENDGRYRFSYTVSGTPLGSPSLRPSDGAVLLGTTRRLIYAVNQRGGLYFRASTVAPVWSGLYPLDKDSVVYLGLDRRVYALSNYGGALYRVLLPSMPSGEPVIGEDGLVWIPLESGLARLHRAMSLLRFPVAGRIEQVVAVGSHALVQARGHALWYGKKGLAADLGEARWIFGGDQLGVLVTMGGELSLVDARGSVRSISLSRWEQHLASQVVAPGALSRGEVWLPLSGGRVWRRGVGANGSSGLLESGLAEVGGLVVRDGRVAAFSPSGNVCVSAR